MALWSKESRVSIPKGPWPGQQLTFGGDLWVENVIFQNRNDSAVTDIGGRDRNMKADFLWLKFDLDLNDMWFQLADIVSHTMCPVLALLYVRFPGRLLSSLCEYFSNSWRFKSEYSSSYGFDFSHLDGVVLKEWQQGSSKKKQLNKKKNLIQILIRSVSYLGLGLLSEPGYGRAHTSTIWNILVYIRKYIYICAVLCVRKYAKLYIPTLLNLR